MMREAKRDVLAFRCGVFTDPKSALQGTGVGGDAYDNTFTETTVGLFRPNCIGRGRLSPPARCARSAMSNATMGWIDWFNDRSLHSHLGYIPPERRRADAYYAHPPGVQPGRRLIPSPTIPVPTTVKPTTRITAAVLRMSLPTLSKTCQCGRARLSTF
jgi:hypothetical protein